jgi:hypothetical protein
MKDLVGRLAALDPDAGAALKVIAYFDALVEGRAGLEPIVRGAAVLAGCAARLVDEERRVHLRVDPEGHVRDEPGPPAEEWVSASFEPGGPPVLWLERPGPAGPVDAMVLERALSAARGVLDRTRGRAPGDPASVEVVLDRSAAEGTRLRAARRLGLRETARVVVLEGGRSKVEPAGPVRVARGRAGIGPVVPVLELPSSWDAARTALRFAAEGTEQDPGPRVVYSDELGGLAVLASAIGPGSEPVADVLAVERARSAAPWVLATLVAVASSPSLRTAASTLVVHHSTVQERVGQMEKLLGWSVREPQGRLRLQLALALWRLHRHQYE